MKTTTQRAADIVAAANGITDLIQVALNTSADHGAEDPRTLAAWEAVEKRGAVIHRQSRPLAGKSKGG